MKTVVICRYFGSLARIAVVVAPFVSLGCSTSECLDNQNSRPKAVFLSSGGPDAGKSLTVPSLTVYGIGAPGDSILESNGNLSQLTLPFRLGEEKTRYVFEYGGDLEGLADTLTFTYRPVPEFVSAP